MDFDDDEDVVARAKSSPPAHFAFDDAFSDTDDSLEFSPEAIREDMAKNLGATSSFHADHEEMRAFAVKIGFSVDPDASVSTLDMHTPSRVHPPPPPPMQRSLSDASEFPSHPSEDDSLYDIQLSNHLSEVTLSDDGSSPSPSPQPQEAEHDHEAAQNHTAAYPAVQIDVAEPHPVVSELQATPSSGSEQDVLAELPSRSVSHDEFRSRTLASPASAASTSSLPLPTSTSLPNPKSPTSNASNTSNISSTSNASNASNVSHVSNASNTSTIFFHRSARSMGPSALDKVISKTRPPFLPPKSRKEDRKHMADWETMMKRSRAAEEKRRKTLQHRRLERERRIEESIHIWQRDIVPDWTVVHRDPASRKLWWEGIPTKLRASMWQNAVGNSLVLGKDAYKTSLSRAKRALASGTFPTTVLGLLEDDIASTLPSLHLFRPEVGPLYEDLKEMLCAWVVSRSDEGLGYVPGVAKIAAMILINMSPPQGFIVMRNLLDRHCLRSFYGGMASRDAVEAYYRIFDTLLADGMPKIYFNFKQHQISPDAYLPDWLIPLFLDHLPFEACARIWDIILLEGDAFLYRAALAILAVLEPRLFFPDKNELLELLKGENKAALEVAKRDGLPLNGAKYEIYGVDEETLWERIESMDEWWRASTWTRLIQRELPDL
ncbi:RabGAP/TBC protein [Sparassis crispa]|uniref:RabGAP/TBC protein n=1 Tax=Sparassis crispa TaxID=139825 RepID=A0A401G627_9APHY|nr:RabGAP/TBC protein [Sparassis crispa]GBE77620.1 RabGAP/TBC protein [Sparassis crispa]